MVSFNKFAKNIFLQKLRTVTILYVQTGILQSHIKQIDLKAGFLKGFQYEMMLKQILHPSNIY